MTQKRRKKEKLLQSRSQNNSMTFKISSLKVLFDNMTHQKSLTATFMTNLLLLKSSLLQLTTSPGCALCLILRTSVSKNLKCVSSHFTPDYLVNSNSTIKREWNISISNWLTTIKKKLLKWLENSWVTRK
jgi:hypothetical protein